MKRKESEKPHINATNRLSRIWYLRGPYQKLITSGLFRIGVKDLVRTQFPYLLSDAEVPPSINIEFANRCQLQCTYCTSPLKLRPAGFMSASTFQRAVAQIRDCRIKRVRVVGNGEPTLHPDFSSMIRKVAESTDYVELKTNWQSTNENVVHSVVEANIDAVRISVDANTEKGYEAIRRGGDFHALLANLQRLMRVRDSLKGKSLIIVTVMLKPTDLKHEPDLMQFWKPYCDLVSKQYVLDMETGEIDSFTPTGRGKEWPRCSLPFKELKIFWDGNVPLCKYSHLQTGEPMGVRLGNINTQTIPALWNSPVMKQYRNGHRTRNKADMPVCRGCFGT